LEWVDKHSWPGTREEAYNFQDTRLDRLEIIGNTVEPKTIVAVEATYGRDAAVIYAAAVVFSFPEHKYIENKYVQFDTAFEYVPSLFYFREGPALVAALEEIETDVDLIMINGHGIDHPRNCGIATHIGMDFDKPAIGCARRLLAGQHQPVGEEKGDSQQLFHLNKEVGVVYRSRERVKPIFISPGHKCNIEFAHNIIVRSLRDYRLPEQLRAAHRLANKNKRFSESNKPHRSSYDRDDD